MLRKAAIALVALAILWIAASGTASASLNQQTELTPFEYLIAAIEDARENGALTDTLRQTLADHFFDELIPSATRETPAQVRERLKDQLYPHHTPTAFEMFRAALSGADESGALTDEISGLLHDYFIAVVIPSATGDTPEDVRERLSDPVRIGEKVAGFYVKRGQIYSEDGNFELAIADLSRAIELDPDSPDRYYDRANLYRLAGEYDLAVADMTIAIKYAPDDPYLYGSRAKLHREAGKYEQAIADLTIAIQIEPEGTDFYEFRGSMYLRIGDIDRANSDFLQAIAVDPEHRHIYTQHALDHYEDAISAAPDSAELYHGRASFHFQTGESGQAILDYTKAIELSPNNPAFYRGRAWVYLETGEYELAIQDYTRTIELNPNDPVSYVGRASAHHAIGGHRSAIEDYTRAIELDPDNPDLYAARAWAYYEAGLYGRASSDNGKALRLDPDNPERYTDRARLLRKIGHPESALSAYGRAIELKPDNPYLYYDRATLYHELGRYQEAIEDYTRAIELEPDNAGFYQERGIAYEAAGDDDRAIEDYLAAIRLDQDLIELHPNLGNLHFQRALDQGIAITGSELPWLVPGLASVPPGFGVYFNHAFTFYEILLDTDHTNIPAYVSTAHIFIWNGEAEAITEDSGYIYPNVPHPAADYFKDVYYNPEAYEDSASVLAIVGKAHRETGKYDLAIADFDRAIELDPESPLHYRDRGIALYLNGDYDLAIADFDTAISILPDDAYLYLFRALAYHMKSEYRHAVSDYDLAIAVNPDDPYFHFFRSVALKALGEQNEYENYFALLEDEYDMQLALTLLLPAVPVEESRAAAD